MEVVRTSEIIPIETPEGNIRAVLFGSNACVIHLEVPPGIKVQPHAHPREILLYCLKGECHLTAGARQALFSEGSAARITPGELLGLWNEAPMPAEFVVVSAPPPANSREEFEDYLQKGLGERENG